MKSNYNFAFSSVSAILNHITNFCIKKFLNLQSKYEGQRRKAGKTATVSSIKTKNIPTEFSCRVLIIQIHSLHGTLYMCLNKNKTRNVTGGLARSTVTRH